MFAATGVWRSLWLFEELYNDDTAGADLVVLTITAKRLALYATR